MLKQLSNLDVIPDDELDDDTMIPIMPQVQQPPQLIPKVEKQTDIDPKPAMLPRVIGTAIKVENHDSNSNHGGKYSKQWNIN